MGKISKGGSELLQLVRAAIQTGYAHGHIA